MQYSKEVLDHFTNPRNVGEIKDADGVGEVGNPVCGDMMTFYIKVSPDGKTLDDVKFKTFGCGAAIAVSSMISEMAKGKSIEDALKITKKDVADRLGGLPEHKMHCSNLGADALRKAVEDFRNKSGAAQPAEHGKSCNCPFCGGSDQEPEACKPCGKEFVKCPGCGKYHSSSLDKCPDCGK